MHATCCPALPWSWTGIAALHGRACVPAQLRPARLRSPQPAGGRVGQPLLGKQPLQHEAQRAQHRERRTLLRQPRRRLGPVVCTAIRRGGQEGWLQHARLARPGGMQPCAPVAVPCRARQQQQQQAQLQQRTCIEADVQAHTLCALRLHGSKTIPVPPAGCPADCTGAPPQPCRAMAWRGWVRQAACKGSKLTNQALPACLDDGHTRVEDDERPLAHRARLLQVSGQASNHPKP